MEGTNWDVGGLCFNATFLEVDAEKRLTSRVIWCADHWWRGRMACGIQASMPHFLPKPQECRDV